jgi:hypothetical protein
MVITGRLLQLTLLKGISQWKRDRSAYLRLMNGIIVLSFLTRSIKDFIRYILPPINTIKAIQTIGPLRRL